MWYRWICECGLFSHCRIGIHRNCPRIGNCRRHCSKSETRRWERPSCKWCTVYAPKRIRLDTKQWTWRAFAWMPDSSVSGSTAQESNIAGSTWLFDWRIGSQCVCCDCAAGVVNRTTLMRVVISPMGRLDPSLQLCHDAGHWPLVFRHFGQVFHSNIQLDRLIWCDNKNQHTTTSL